MLDVIFGADRLTLYPKLVNIKTFMINYHIFETSMIIINQKTSLFPIHFDKNIVSFIKKRVL